MTEPAAHTNNDEAVREAVLDLACRLRDNDHLGTRRAVRAVLDTAGGDVGVAVLVAAQMIDVDRPVVRWWDGDDGRPRCAHCHTPNAQLSYRRLYCGETCFRDARRAYWRTRKAAARAKARRGAR